MAAYASSSGISYTVKPELDPLEREKSEIERRRARFEDRKQRILHAKTRIIGIDVDALSEQIADKQEKEKLEMERNLYYDDMTLQHARTISLQAEARRIDERRSAESMNIFRRQQIAEKQARTRVNNSNYANMASEDGNFLKFIGEDEEKKERLKKQQKQQEDWLNEQIAQTRKKEERNRQDEVDYHHYQTIINQQQARNEEDRERQKKDENRKLVEYNKQLAGQKSLDNRRNRLSNQSKDDEEIALSLSSSLMNEAVPTSSLGEHRSIPYNFKGFSTQKRQQMLDDQLGQQIELRERRDREAVEEKDFATQQENIRREMLIRDREKNRKEKEKAIALKDERLLQQKQKMVKTQYLNNVVYTNPVGEEYFNQFGTSCR